MRLVITNHWKLRRQALASWGHKFITESSQLLYQVGTVSQSQRRAGSACFLHTGGFGFPESPFRKIPLVHTYAHRGASKHVQAREGCSTILGNSQQYHKLRRGHQRKQVCPGRVRLHYHRGSGLCLVDTPTQASPITLGEGETARVVTHLLLLFPPSGVIKSRASLALISGDTHFLNSQGVANTRQAQVFRVNLWKV